MGYPKDLPIELRGLWKAQYMQKESFMKGIMHNNLSFLRDYNKRPYTKKLVIIDNLQKRNFFGR